MVNSSSTVLALCTKTNLNVPAEAPMCLRDMQDQTSLVIVCQASTLRFDVLYACPLINVYM